MGERRQKISEYSRLPLIFFLLSPTVQLEATNTTSSLIEGLTLYITYSYIVQTLLKKYEDTQHELIDRFASEKRDLVKKYEAVCQEDKQEVMRKYEEQAQKDRQEKLSLIDQFTVEKQELVKKYEEQLKKDKEVRGIENHVTGCEFSQSQFGENSHIIMLLIPHHTFLLSSSVRAARNYSRQSPTKKNANFYD